MAEIARRRSPVELGDQVGDGGVRLLPVPGHKFPCRDNLVQVVADAGVPADREAGDRQPERDGAFDP
ncbi:MAG: hypothetical protein EOP24_39660 [Hyphomicrobiales bacterium]|nr:MAG: hypothetical protein EOP24_39660 [Hyphomicrobiales bacterium]